MSKEYIKAILSTILYYAVEIIDIDDPFTKENIINTVVNNTFVGSFEEVKDEGLILGDNAHIIYHIGDENEDSNTLYFIEVFNGCTYNFLTKAEVEDVFDGPYTELNIVKSLLARNKS